MGCLRSREEVVRIGIRRWGRGGGNGLALLARESGRECDLQVCGREISDTGFTLNR